MSNHQSIYLLHIVHQLLTLICTSFFYSTGRKPERASKTEHEYRRKKLSTVNRSQSSSEFSKSTCSKKWTWLKEFLTLSRATSDSFMLHAHYSFNHWDDATHLCVPAFAAKFATKGTKRRNVKSNLDLWVAHRKLDKMISKCTYKSASFSIYSTLQWLSRALREMVTQKIIENTFTWPC